MLFIIAVIAALLTLILYTNLKKSGRKQEAFVSIAGFVIALGVIVFNLFLLQIGKYAF